MSRLNKLANLPSVFKQEALEIAAELARRETEALALIEPLPQQKEFINLTSIYNGARRQTRIRAATGPNRSSKTFTNLYDWTLMVLGQHPWRQFPKGYSGRCFMIGRKLESLALIYYKKLLTPSFMVIRDEQTNLLRPYRPLTDSARRDEAVQGPPLIAQRYLVDDPKYWEKGTRQIKFMHIRNDYEQEWLVYFFSGMGDAPRGDDVDDIRITEEQDSQAFLKELYPRLMDRKGCLSWDFTAQDGTDEAMRLLDEADRDEDNPEADVRAIRFSLRTNPHIDQQEIGFQIRQLGEEEARVRIDGVPASKTWKMFPEFSLNATGIEPSEFGGDIPENWCIYVTTDPGYAKAGVAFWAIPPPMHPLGAHVILFDELFLQQKTEDELVASMARKLVGREAYAHIMDFPMSNRTEITGVKIGEYMRRALQKHGLRFKETGFDYRPGFRDTVLGADFVRDAIQPRFKHVAGDEVIFRSRLLVVVGRCKNFVTEMQSLRRKRERDRNGNWVYFDVPQDKQTDELYDCARYAMADDLTYHLPRTRGDVLLRENSRKFRELLKLKRRNYEPSHGICLGPRAAASNAVPF